MASSCVPFFSVIVPVYNSEEFISDCIESVINQTFVDWELILVDDGSTDYSGQICDEYALKDNRITVVHKENGGEFSSRKAGIDIAKGVYITGVDADDYYECTHLAELYVVAQNYDVDCIAFNLKYVGDRSGVDLLFKDERVLEGGEFVLEVVNKTNPSFVNKAFRREVIKGVDYSDVPHVRFSEDELMVYPALCVVRNACTINISSYCYRVHSQSISSCGDFKQIEYNDQVIEYVLKRFEDSAYYSDSLRRVLINSFLHMLNVRIWEIMLAGKWIDNMREKIKSLILYKTAVKEVRFSDFKIKERIRVRLILNEQYKLLLFFSGFYRLFGFRGVTHS